jgi:hypothetical protein
LAAASSFHCCTPESWRRLEQQRKAQRKVKARGRVAKMLARKADREAATAGLVWDTMRGAWRKP